MCVCVRVLPAFYRVFLRRTRPANCLDQQTWLGRRRRLDKHCQAHEPASSRARLLSGLLQNSPPPPPPRDQVIIPDSQGERKVSIRPYTPKKPNPSDEAPPPGTTPKLFIGGLADRTVTAGLEVSFNVCASATLFCSRRIGQGGRVVVVVAAAAADVHWRGRLTPSCARCRAVRSFAQEHFSRFGNVEDCIVMMHPDG